MPDAPVSRRSFLDSLMYGSLAAAALAALAPVPFYLVPPPGVLRRVVVGKAASITATKFAYGTYAAIALRDGAELRVLDARCTHQGCIVNWDAAAGLLVCPCHGARFKPSGEPVRGPHHGPLRTIPHRVTEAGDLEAGG